MTEFLKNTWVDI